MSKKNNKKIKQSTKKEKSIRNRKNWKNWLISLSAIILAGAMAIGVALPLTMCSPTPTPGPGPGPTPPKPGDSDFKSIGNYDGASNPNLDHPIVYIKKDQNKDEPNVLRFMEIKVGSSLADQYGCTGWIVFGTKIENLNGTNTSAYNLDIDANTIPENILINGVEEHIKNIGCFKGDAITSVVIPNFIEIIASNAFENCISLVTLNLSNATNLLIIGRNAFLSCYSLKNLDLSNAQNLRTINSFAFANCSNLTGSLIIPANLSSIDVSSFSYHPQSQYLNYKTCHFTTIDVAAGNATFIKANNLGSNCSAILRKSTQTSFDFSKPANSQVISSGLICGELEIANTVTSIVDSGFNNCSGLTSLNLDNATNLSIIGKYAFKDCFGLSNNLTFPKSLTIISDNAFENCINLTGILTIPITTTKIGTGAFKETNFTEVNFQQENPLSISAGVDVFAKLTGPNNKIIIYVPAPGLSSWQNTFNIDKILGIADINQIQSK